MENNSANVAHAAQPAPVVAEAPIPKNFWQYLKSWGPGIILVLSWLGAGDLVDNTVAGAHYGYTLLWVLTISILLRFFFVHTLAKYDLCNVNGDTLVQGFGRVGKWCLYYLIFACVVYVHLSPSFLLTGMAEIIHAITGISVPVAGIVMMLIIAALVLANTYNSLEKLFKVFLVVLGAVFFYGMFAARPDAGEVIKGALIPNIPSGALLITAALIGAVYGTPLNLTYSVFTRTKGWQDHRYMKVARFDLVFSCVAMLLIDLAIWVVGAAYIKPAGITVSGVSDLVYGFTQLLGKAGTWLCYAGYFSAVFTTYIGAAVAISNLVSDCVKEIKGHELKNYKCLGQYHSKIWYVVLAWGMLTPCVWLFTSVGFVTLTIVNSALMGTLMPVLLIITIKMTNDKKLIGEHRNNLFENIMLCLGFCLVTFCSISTFVSWF